MSKLLQCVDADAVDETIFFSLSLGLSDASSAGPGWKHGTIESGLGSD
jgi:hypothetical protein